MPSNFFDDDYKPEYEETAGGNAKYKIKWYLIFWVMVVVALLMSFLDVSKEDVQTVVKQQIEIQSQQETVAKNAVEINKKANIALDENDELRKQLREALNKASDLHNELVQCKKQVPTDYVGTGY